MFVSALFRKFYSCFGLFDIPEKTKYMYIDGKIKIHLHSLQHRPDKFAFSVSKACTYIFSDNIYIYYLYITDIPQ